MIVPEITLYQIAKAKFGEDTATEFVSALKETVDSKFKEKESIFLTKDDKTEIIKWMFVFWTAQMVAQIASLIAIFKFTH